VSAVARGFVRRRNWFDNLDGQPFRDLTPYEQNLWMLLRGEAAFLIEFMAS
jgi:hypothetical protein